MKSFLLATILTLAFFLSACNSTDSTSQPEKPDLEKVTMLLEYVPNTNHSGLFVAEEKGYFEEEGLDVTIVEPSDVPVTTMIASGKGDFGISAQEDVTYARLAEDPLPIRAVATILQHNTSGFASFSEKNISRPRDFEGKTYAGWGSPSEEAIIRAVMENDQADFSRLKRITADDLSYASLPNQVDLIWIFWAWDGISAQRAGIPIHFIKLAEIDSRLDYYTPLIIASENTLEKRGETTRKFLRATSRGYEFCVEHPEEAAAILHETVPEYDMEMLKESQTYLAGKYMEDTEQWGIMKDSVWNNYSSFMLENGLISHGISPEECYSNAYLPTDQKN